MRYDANARAPRPRPTPTPRRTPSMMATPPPRPQVRPGPSIPMMSAHNPFEALGNPIAEGAGMISPENYAGIARELGVDPERVPMEAAMSMGAAMLRGGMDEAEPLRQKLLGGEPGRASPAFIDDPNAGAALEPEVVEPAAAPSDLGQLQAIIQRMASGGLEPIDTMDEASPAGFEGPLYEDEGEQPGLGQAIGRSILSPLSMLNDVILGNNVFPGVLGTLGIGKEAAIARAKRAEIAKEERLRLLQDKLEADLRIRGAQLPKNPEQERLQRQLLALRAEADGMARGRDGAPTAAPEPGTEEEQGWYEPVISGLTEFLWKNTNDRHGELLEMRARRELNEERYGALSGVVDSLEAQADKSALTRRQERTLELNEESGDRADRRLELDEARFLREGEGKGDSKVLEKLESRKEILQGKMERMREDVEDEKKRRMEVLKQVRIASDNPAERAAAIQMAREVGMDVGMINDEWYNPMKDRLVPGRYVGEGDDREFEEAPLDPIGMPESYRKLEDQVNRIDEEILRLQGGEGDLDGFSGTSETGPVVEDEMSDEDIEEELARLIQSGASQAKIDQFLDAHGAGK